MEKQLRGSSIQHEQARNDSKYAIEAFQNKLNTVKKELVCQEGVLNAQQEQLQRHHVQHRRFKSAIEAVNSKQKLLKTDHVKKRIDDLGNKLVEMQTLYNNAQAKIDSISKGCKNVEEIENSVTGNELKLWHAIR